MAKINHIEQFANLEWREKQEVAISTFEKLSCSEQNKIVDVIEQIEGGIKKRGGRIGRQSTMELITALGLFLADRKVGKNATKS